MIIIIIIIIIITESRKGDGVNRLVCILGDKLISHLIAFKRQKKKGNCQYQQILILALAAQRFTAYSLSS